MKGRKSNNTMSNSILLCNGFCRTNTGGRSVSFNNKLELMPVVYRTHSGFKPSRATFQIEGSIVVTRAWGRSHDTETLLVDREISLDHELLRQVFEKHLWLNEWLGPVGRTDSWLPLEVAPIEADLSFINKRKAKEFFEQRFGVELPESVMQSPKVGLSYKPIEMPDGLLQTVPHHHHWTGSVVGIDQYEEWYVSKGDGTPARKLNIMSEGESGSNYAHSETSYSEGEPVSEALPADAKGFMIRVVHGAYTHEHYSYGCTVDVWKL